MTRLLTAAITVVLTLPPFTAFGQEQSRSSVPLSALEPGAKIRVAAPAIPESERVGRFDSVRADSIFFRPDSRSITRALSLQSVGTIEVSRHAGTRKANYAVIGAIAGGIIGFISSNHNGQGIGTGQTDASQNAIVGGAAGVAIGGVLGWWYGGKKKVERWQPVDR